MRLVAACFLLLAPGPVAHVFIENQPHDKDAKANNGSAQGSYPKDSAQNQTENNQAGESYDPRHVRVVLQLATSLSTWP